MLEQLFGSKTRVKLLAFFLRNPEQIHFIREITREIDSHINAVRREIALLESAGLLECVPKGVENDESRDNHKYYRLVPQHILYPEVKALFFKEQIAGQHAVVEEIKERMGVVNYFILSGIFVNVPEAPVDMLLVGNIDEKKLKKVISRFEKSLGKPIRYTVFTKKEFRDRKELMDKFLYQILESKAVEIVNNL